MGKLVEVKDKDGKVYKTYRRVKQDLTVDNIKMRLVYISVEGGIKK